MASIFGFRQPAPPKVQPLPPPPERTSDEVQRAASAVRDKYYSPSSSSRALNFLTGGGPAPVGQSAAIQLLGQQKGY